MWRLTVSAIVPHLPSRALSTLPPRVPRGAVVPLRPLRPHPPLAPVHALETDRPGVALFAAVSDLALRARGTDDAAVAVDAFEALLGVDPS